MSPRAQMTASVLDAFDVPMRLGRMPVPTLVPGHVLVRVEVSGVNPLDTKIRTGAAAHARIRLPAVLGIDLAGTVEAVADDVLDLSPGDRVFGMTGGVGEVPGSLAQYAVVDARLVARTPSIWSSRQAAAVPLAAISAWEGLVDRAQVRAGQHVLVHGGAGGVGHLVAQLAAALGAQVSATGSAGEAETIRATGAHPIDYATVSPEAYVDDLTGGSGFDVIFDTVGGATLDASFSSVRRYTGHVVSLLGWGTHDLAPLSFRGASYSGVATLLPLLTGQGRAHHGDILRRVATLAADGLITPRLDERHYSLESVAEAHALVEGGRSAGKVVVDIGV